MLKERYVFTDKQKLALSRNAAKRRLMGCAANLGNIRDIPLFEGVEGHLDMKEAEGIGIALKALTRVLKDWDYWSRQKGLEPGSRDRPRGSGRR